VAALLLRKSLYASAFSPSVMQADQGVDFDFLRAPAARGKMPQSR
jgi:hypothetical protein